MGQLPEGYERIAVPPTKAWHTWVLSDHYESVASAGVRQRTYLGDLLYRAKYRHDRGALETLATAVRHSVLQLRGLPPQVDALATVSAVVAVPCNPPKFVSVPHEIARAAADSLGIPDFSSVVVKTRETGAAKTNPVRCPEAYEVRRRLDGVHVLVVDDLYHTGATLDSVAAQLRAAGAAHIVGLCVTKVYKGMSP